MNIDGYLFDAECAREDFADAVLAGMQNWAASQ
jgi:hypothetical protein